MHYSCRPSTFVFPSQDWASCMKTNDPNDRLDAEIGNITVMGDNSVVIRGQFQSSPNITSVLNSHVLNFRWTVGGTSYKQSVFLNSTVITLPQNPEEKVQFQATFSNVISGTANYAGSLKARVVITHWSSRKKEACLRWKLKL